jgi:hypothetical protein
LTKNVWSRWLAATEDPSLPGEEKKVRKISGDSLICFLHRLPFPDEIKSTYMDV